MIQIALYIIQDCVCASSYIEMSSIQSLYMLYSIGPLWCGANIMEKLIIVIRIILAMVKHITVDLYMNCDDIKSFWHYVYPFRFTVGLNVIIIRDPTYVVNNHIHYTHNHHIHKMHYKQYHITGLLREFIGLLSQSKITTMLTNTVSHNIFTIIQRYFENTFSL